MVKEKEKTKKTKSDSSKSLKKESTKKSAPKIAETKKVAENDLKITKPAVNQDAQDDFRVDNAKTDRYFEAIGRRKTAVARVRLFTKGEKLFLVNGKSYKEYFPLLDDQNKAISSMEKMKCFDKFRVTVIVKGGGRSAQAEAVRHGTARVLVIFNNNFKKRLRKVGYLTRDPRMRERKKFGLKRARKSPQWSKR